MPCVRRNARLFVHAPSDQPVADSKSQDCAGQETGIQDCSVRPGCEGFPVPVGVVAASIRDVNLSNR